MVRRSLVEVIATSLLWDGRSRMVATERGIHRAAEGGRVRRVWPPAANNGWAWARDDSNSARKPRTSSGASGPARAKLKITERWPDRTLVGQDGVADAKTGQSRQDGLGFPGQGVDPDPEELPVQIGPGRGRPVSTLVTQEGNHDCPPEKPGIWRAWG